MIRAGQDAHFAIGEKSFRLHTPYEICQFVDVHSTNRLPLALCRRILPSSAEACAFEGSIVAAHCVHEWARATCMEESPKNIRLISTC